MANPFDRMGIDDVAAVTERIMASLDIRESQEVTPEWLGLECGPGDGPALGSADPDRIP
ncbi:hypothetical protein ACIP5Y_26890 [Nocardia sp. NPDC088792]|uniref:hypothetical protein n=1 Tax=Nocardia sp. NPDC088792 TaxID=3364332 RepID=UPI0037F979E6